MIYLDSILLLFIVLTNRQMRLTLSILLLFFCLSAHTQIFVGKTYEYSQGYGCGGSDYKITFHVDSTFHYKKETFSANGGGLRDYRNGYWFLSNDTIYITTTEFNPEARRINRKGSFRYRKCSNIFSNKVKVSRFCSEIQLYFINDSIYFRKDKNGYEMKFTVIK